MVEERIEDQVSSTEGETAGFHVWLDRGSNGRPPESWGEIDAWLHAIEAKGQPVRVFGWDSAPDATMIYRAFGYGVEDQYDLVLKMPEEWEEARRARGESRAMRIGPNTYERLLFVFSNKDTALLFKLTWAGDASGLPGLE